MGTTLTGTTPQDTYDSLIKVTDNGPISGTAKYLSDGLGNDSALALSTSVVGINTSSPNTNYPLSVASASNANAIAVFGRASDNTGSIDFYQSNGSSRILEFGVSTTQVDIYNDLNTPILFSTNATERLRITGAGAVQIKGASTTTGHQAAIENTETLLTLYGSIFGGTGKGIAFWPTGAAEGMRLTTNGLTFNGDTAAANALDDYEEGTWTMGVSFGGASAGITYDASTLATYTKIGRQVTVNGFVALTSKGSSTGSARITGLPFTIANSSGYYSAAAMRLQSINFVGQFQAYGSINSTTVLLQQTTTLGINTDITDTEFSNSSQIMISFTYFV
jgi:hypothetical protein